MNNENELDKELALKMVKLWTEIVNTKPQDRSEKARRYAVTITEFEKVMSYFFGFVLNQIDLNPE